MKKLKNSLCIVFTWNWSMKCLRNVCLIFILHIQANKEDFDRERIGKWKCHPKCKIKYNVKFVLYHSWEIKDGGIQILYKIYLISQIPHDLLKLQHKTFLYLHHQRKKVQCSQEREDQVFLFGRSRYTPVWEKAVDYSTPPASRSSRDFCSTIVRRCGGKDTEWSRFLRAWAANVRSDTSPWKVQRRNRMKNSLDVKGNTDCRNSTPVFCAFGVISSSFNILEKSWKHAVHFANFANCAKWLESKVAVRNNCFLALVSFQQKYKN